MSFIWGLNDRRRGTPPKIFTTTVVLFSTSHHYCSWSHGHLYFSSASPYTVIIVHYWLKVFLQTISYIRYKTALYILLNFYAWDIRPCGCLDKKMAPIDSYGIIRGCGLVEGNVSLGVGFESGPASVSLPACWQSRCRTLSYLSSPCMSS